MSRRHDVVTSPSGTRTVTHSQALGARIGVETDPADTPHSKCQRALVPGAPLDAAVYLQRMGGSRCTVGAGGLRACNRTTTIARARVADV